MGRSKTWRDDVEGCDLGIASGQNVEKEDSSLGDYFAAGVIENRDPHKKLRRAPVTEEQKSKKI